MSGPAHRQRVAAAAAKLHTRVEGGTGLYDTIWAAYRKAKASYDHRRVNAVIVLTRAATRTRTASA